MTITSPDLLVSFISWISLFWTMLTNSDRISRRTATQCIRVTYHCYLLLSNHRAKIVYRLLWQLFIMACLTAIVIGGLARETADQYVEACLQPENGTVLSTATGIESNSNNFNVGYVISLIDELYGVN